MKWTKRILGVLVLIIALLAVFVQFSWNKKHQQEVPVLSATTDSAMIARGKYLAYGPAHCATCHMPMDKIMEVENGKEYPLSGGWEMTIPPATVRAPNLTPDAETGIGNIPDEKIVRAMRYSINHRDEYMLPFMPFQELSDEDVTAILSFLRSQPAVKNEVKPTEYTFLGKALLAFGLLKPEGPKATPPQRIVPDSSIEYGSYLANRVANCVGCHTDRDMNTGAFIGEPFAGGMLFEADEFTKGHQFISPNLTPHPATGIIAEWSEQVFIDRFREGRRIETSPMPWGAVSRMDEIELKALYRYLRSVPAIDKKVNKVMFAPGEKVEL